MNAKKAYIGKIACIVLSWCFFVFSFTYGNALSEQKRYTDFRVRMVLDDLKNIEMQDDSITEIQLCGNIGRSPIIRNMPQDYQMLNRLIPQTFGNAWQWSEAYFWEYFNLNTMKTVKLIGVEDASYYDFTELDLPVIQDTMYHTIRGDEKHILIELKETFD